MAATKKMFPVGTSASLGGYISPGGELLMAVNLTQEEVDEWNGVKPKPKKKAAPKVNENSTKIEMEAAGRKAGIELDRRKSKKSLWSQLKKELFPKK